MARDHAFLSMKRPVRLKNEQAKMHMSHVDVSTFASTCLILTHLRVHLRAHTCIHLRTCPLIRSFWVSHGMNCKVFVILLMEEILHRFIGSLPHCLHFIYVLFGFIWCTMFSMNGSFVFVPGACSWDTYVQIKRSGSELRKGATD